MKKALILFCGLLTGLLRTASATTVTWGAAPTARIVTLEDGTTTVTSGLVLVGAFASTAFTFNPSLDIATNFSLISTAGGWKQFTLDTVSGTPDASVSNTMTITATGKVGGAVTDNNNSPTHPIPPLTKADFFDGKQIYIWLFNNASIASATQMGIFTATTASPSWIYPNNAGGAGDGLSVGTTTTTAATMVAAGTVGVGSTTSAQLRLVASVPEPSVLALGGVAGLGMLASRKRRQRK